MMRLFSSFPLRIPVSGLKRRYWTGFSTVSLKPILQPRGSSAEVVFTLLAQMDADGREIITIYYGQEIAEAVAQALGQEVAAAYPDQEIEVISGGQPHYCYIISAE